MIREIERLLNIKTNALDAENGLDVFKSAISNLRQESENLGAERSKQEHYQAGERSTFKKVANALTEIGFENVNQSKLIDYLNSDDFKSKLGSKEISDVDIKSSETYKKAVKDLQAKIQEVENEKKELSSKILDISTSRKKEEILLPLLSEFDTSNENITNLVKANILNNYQINDDGFAMKDGSLLEDDIKNPMKFESVARREIEKYLPKKSGKTSPHDKSGGSSGAGSSKIIGKLSEYGIQLPTNSNELVTAIRDSSLPLEFRRELNAHREEIEATFAE